MTNNIDEILQLSKEDLYAILEADDDVNVDISLDELSSTDYTQFADSEWNIEVSPRIKLSPQFLGVGKKSLKKIWKAVLTIICKIYKIRCFLIQKCSTIFVIYKIR